MRLNLCRRPGIKDVRKQCDYAECPGVREKQGGGREDTRRVEVGCSFESFTGTEGSQS